MDERLDAPPSSALIGDVNPADNVTDTKSAAATTVRTIFLSMTSPSFQRAAG